MIDDVYEYGTYGDHPSPSSFGVVMSAEEPPGLDLIKSNGQQVGKSFYEGRTADIDRGVAKSKSDIIIYSKNIVDKN